MEPQTSLGNIVDLVFPLRGTTIPADHGYALFAALCRYLPQLHGDKRLGIHAINGRFEGNRQLSVTTQSRLRIRLQAERVSEFVKLVGQELEIGGQHLALGFPTIQPLTPASSLFSRCVVIRGFLEPESFLYAVRRQLYSLTIQGIPALVPRPVGDSVEGRALAGRGGWVRRTLCIHDKEIVGYAVRVDHLTAEESLLLQQVGLGGRRHFGCGLFLPRGRRG